MPDIYHAKVETVSVYTHLPIRPLELWYGVPNAGTSSYRSNGTVGYLVMYHHEGNAVILTSASDCPAHLLVVTQAKAQISISIGYGRSVPPTYFELSGFCRG